MSGKVINVLGFDPSFTNWGIVSGTYNIETGHLHLRDCEVITTKKSKVKTLRVASDRMARGRILHEGILVFIPGTHVIFAEVPVGSQSAVAAFGLGIATGILATVKPSPIEVTPAEVKKAAVGSVQASKAAMISWAYKLHPNLPWPKRKDKLVAGKAEHIADAVAVIYAGIATTQFQQLIGVYKT